MTDLEQFNEFFPNSKYREIPAHYNGSDHKRYQASKAPLNNKIVDFNTIKDTVNRIGWIVPNEYIVVDLDDMEEAKIVNSMLQKMEIKYALFTSKHGAHFLFKNKRRVGQTADKITSIGMTVDTRCLEKGYIVLPHHDPDRKWKHITNDVDEIPSWLVPLPDLNKLNQPFYNMEEGSRNTELFAHVMNLKDYAKELNKDEIISAMHIINEYLLKNPLDKSELENTILRDEIVKEIEKPKADKKAPIEEKLAEKILSEKHIITVNGTMYLYNDKYYKECNDVEIERLIHIDYNSKLKEQHRKEVIKFIKLKTYVNPKEINKNWNEITFKNGILNLSDMSFVPHTHLIYNTIYINHEYNERVEYSNIVDSFFNTLSNKDEYKKKLLYEIAGYALLKKPVLSKFFIVDGEGLTGKSTYLQLLHNLMGEDNTTFLDLQDMDDKFKPAELFGKLLNISDDLPYKRLGQTSNLKSLVTGGEQLVQKKFGQPFHFRNFATLIFATNKLPPMNDTTSGLYRRLIILKMTNIIENPDPFFLEKLSESDYEYLLYNAIQHIRNALKKNEFTIPQDSSDALDAFKVKQSSVLSFLQEYKYDANILHGRPAREVYAEYKEYAVDSGQRPMVKRSFYEDIQTELKMTYRNTTLNGDNQCWRFMKMGV